MNEQQALETLAAVRLAIGRTYKAAIRNAWECGNYRAVYLEEWQGQLQNIRNAFGPSWLVKANPSKPPADPRQVGGVYFCGYWRRSYRVLSVDVVLNGVTWWETHWADGNTTLHCTPWNPKHDRILVTTF